MNESVFRTKLVDEANAAIDEMVQQASGIEEYVPVIRKRDSILCYMLRSMYFLGKTRAAAEFNEAQRKGEQS